MDPADPSKPSRYRSVRVAAATAPAAVPSQQSGSSSEDVHEGSTINRSRSRYHRRPNATAHPAMPAPAAQEDPPRSNSSGGVERIRNATEAFAEHSREYLDTVTPPLAQERVLTPRAEAERRRRLDENSASRQASAEGSRDRNEIRNPRPADNYYDRPFQVDQPPQQTMAATADSKADKKIFGLFKRKTSVTQQQDMRLEPDPDGPQFIKAGGGGIVPGIDAPKSAVNAGERRVVIECNRVPMQFPFDPMTTASDLLQSAANCFSEQIDPKSFVLMEMFNKVGVQRPLRRYERIRDIMNSWDDDFQNSLIAMRAIDSGADPALLHVANVPRQKPESQSFGLHYSQKVGKWDRRFITIRRDGQVVARKNWNSAEKDAVNVCHLSDFDVYTPTLRQTSKKIRPPKRLCFAVKSQQKSSMFETTTDYVHFFCTDEKDTAIAFYSAVQNWRSWYLVNMMGEGQKPTNNATVPQRAMTQRQSSHGRETADIPSDLHYQLGSFTPLVDPSSLDFERDSLHQGGVQRYSSKRDSRSQPARPRQQLQENEPLANLVDRRTSMDAFSRNSNAFAQGSLLDREYAQRQRESNNDQDTSMRRTTSNQGSDVYRTNSRAGPKPLLDLTPSYRERPQHQRTGGGRPAQQPGAALINSATSPDDGMVQPRSRSLSSGPSRFQNASAFASLTGAPEPPPLRTGSSGGGPANVSAFVPGGLLEQATGGWGDSSRGRGVAGSSSGVSGGRPLIDLQQESQYEKGSLLERMERGQIATSGA